MIHNGCGLVCGLSESTNNATDTANSRIKAEAVDSIMHIDWSTVTPGCVGLQVAKKGDSRKCVPRWNFTSRVDQATGSGPFKNRIARSRA
jgi:hypothetical protein